MQLFGRLQTDVGYTPAQICEMTLEDVEQLFAYWQDYPPIRDLIAAYMGFKPKSSSDVQDRPMSADEFKLLVQSTGGKIPGLASR